MPAVKNVGEPCAGEPHARFDGGREETGTGRHSRAEPGASRLPDHPQIDRHKWGVRQPPRSARAPVARRSDRLWTRDLETVRSGRLGR
jgi:hypothetical protein